MSIRGYSGTTGPYQNLWVEFLNLLTPQDLCIPSSFAAVSTVPDVVSPSCGFVTVFSEKWTTVSEGQSTGWV